jgi:hypothetical protein
MVKIRSPKKFLDKIQCPKFFFWPRSKSEKKLFPIFFIFFSKNIGESFFSLLKKKFSKSPNFFLGHWILAKKILGHPMSARKNLHEKKKFWTF